MSDHNITRHTGTTNETVISADRCRIIALIPEAATAGTITVRDDNAVNGDAAAVKHVAAASLPVAGKVFSQRGARLSTGLTIQLSNGADVVAVIWAPKFS